MDDAVLVTGGTGFLGSHLVDVLVGRGYRVKVLARENSSTSYIDGYVKSGNVELFRGDVTRSDSLLGMADGCFAAYHVAALSRDWGPRKEFQRVNVGGTKNVVTECLRSGISHFIYVSTCGVIGEEDHIEPKDESSEYRPVCHYFMNSVFPSSMNHYRETKCEGERLVREMCMDFPMKLTVARPVWLYGEREFHSGPFILTKMAAKGSRTIPGSPDTLFHTAYAGDVARDLAMLLDRKGDQTETYLLGPKDPLTLGEYHGEFMRGAGCRGPRYIPRWLGYPVGFLLEMVYTLLGTGGPPLLTRARVDMGFFNNV
ncbi:MAG: NAD-dependent epimerase/dehydratase family protein, partial [Candidatus Thermoplasmatota archaeon]|nr:NAD-dependent epimerase/dehydratase family protein [Candidatus Thermoplasmatota archaeon]